MNANKLRAVMVLNGDNGIALSRALGVSQQTLSAKITGKREFTQGEIWKIKDRYRLSAGEIDDIFFAKAVS